MRTLVFLLLSASSLGATLTVKTVCATGCDYGATALQTAINNAAAANDGPQIIELKAGETFDSAGGFTLPARSGVITLTGTADPAASKTLVGSGTAFLTQAFTGDRITVNSETRTVLMVESNTSLTVDVAFTDTAGGASITKPNNQWITIRSSRAAELPGKVRVSPSDTAKMAKITLTTAGTGSYVPAIYTTGAPSSYWLLEGLEVTIGTTGKASMGALVNFGWGYSETETEPIKVSHHFVVDRCYIHGIAFDNGPKIGVGVNADNVQILNSYISEIKRDNAEAQGIMGHSLNGPVYSRNNFIGGATIGSLFGGSGSVNVSMQPMGLQFLGNHYQGTPTHRALRYAGPPQGTDPHPASCSTMSLYYDATPDGSVGAQTYWESDATDFFVCDYYGEWVKVATGITGNVCVDGDFWEDIAGGPAYYICASGAWTSTGSDRTIWGMSAELTKFGHFWSKNRFELKKATGALVEGNLIENCFSPTDQQQACSAILLNWVNDQDGPWATIRDVRIQNNLIRRTALMVTEGSVDLEGRTPYFGHRTPSGIVVDNNLVQDGNNPAIFGALNQLIYRYDSPPVVTAGIGGVGVAQFRHSRFSHNTVINPLASTILWPGGLIYSEANSVGRQVTDNIFELGGITTAARWGGTGAAYGGCLSFDYGGHWTSRSFKNNVAINLGHSVDGSAASYYDTADCQSWAFPWNRSATGLRGTVSGASISGGYLQIGFTGGSHGMLQGTKLTLTKWAPSGLNGIHTILRLGGSDSSCASLALTTQTYQQYICLPTAETGTVTPGDIEATVGYTDWAAQNFRLATATPYKGWATDGSDPGVNQDAVEWATATASSGVDNPYLDFRVRAITPTAAGAVVRFTAYSDAACTWLTSSTRAFGDTLGAWGSGTRIGRDGVITASGLSSNTGYWYQVTCDSKTRDGEFVTTH